jgi:lipoate---protein ligase
LVQGLASIGDNPSVTWTVERLTGSATAFHGREFPDPVARSIWIHDIAAPALALGSSQRVDIVDAAAVAAFEVVRRRSGGGAVLLIPGEVLWVDIVIPADDRLWDADVGRAGHWLGQVWADAIGHGTLVHRGGMVRTPWSGLVCFAGIGPGEVLLDGKKLVGVSQRRTRNGARFQCAIYGTLDPALLPTLLHLSGEERSSVAQALENGVAITPIGLEDTLRRFLELVASA